MSWLARIALVALVAIAAIAVATLGPGSSSPVSRAATEQVYVALGDSIAAGLVTSLPRTRGYPALVRDLIERQASGEGTTSVRLINLAVPGETAASFLADGQYGRLREEVAALRERGAEPRAVTVSLGGNEMLNLAAAGQEQRAAGLEEFRAVYPRALDAVLAALGEVRPAVVVTTYYDLTEGDPAIEGSDAWWVAQFNGVIRQAAAERGIAVADLAPEFRGRVRELTWFPTDIHPNNPGHEVIARVVWRALGFDVQPPAVTVEAPAGDELARPTPTVRVTATDDTAVERVELLVDGEPAGELLYVPAEDAWIGVWDGRGRAGESVTLAARASDLAGNETVVDRTLRVPAR